MADLNGVVPIPSWERDWPGRYKYELDDLRRRQVVFEVDPASLHKGLLTIGITWPSRRGILTLKAVYPDSFPWLRPQVFLLAGVPDLPLRHFSPLDGQLCLLGRDTKQWNPKWTLGDLLDNQLEDALAGTGDEDPQGEPAEVWWNHIASSIGRSFCLVDSTWSPTTGDQGMITARVKLDRGAPEPQLRACIVAVTSTTSRFDVNMEPAVEDLKTVVQVPWVHLDSPPLPVNDPRELLAHVWHLVQQHPALSKCKPQKLSEHHAGRLMAFSYPMETGHREQGTGWLFVLWMGKDQAPKGRNCPRPIQTLRAGPGDLLVRNPEAQKLLGKRITVVGNGAIGGPLAVELAKNGAAALNLIDHDIVEPGNSVRWIAGPDSWGVGKAEGAKEFIGRHYPKCHVFVHRHMIGGLAIEPALGDADVADSVLKASDLVIDATASYGATMWLGSACARLGRPMVSVFAFPGEDEIQGGVSALFIPGRGCPRCLEYSRRRGSTPEDDESVVEPSLQPPGCSERTFKGASFDLQDLSFQAVRMSLAAFRRSQGSAVSTLRFETQAGLRVPIWDARLFEASKECECCSPGD